MPMGIGMPSQTEVVGCRPRFNRSPQVARLTVGALPGHRPAIYIYIYTDYSLYWTRYWPLGGGGAKLTDVNVEFGNKNMLLSEFVFSN